MDQYTDSLVQYIDETKQHHASLVQYMDEWINTKTVRFNIHVSMNPSNIILFVLIYCRMD